LLRWARPSPPIHGGAEELVQRPHDADGAIRVDGVWISPGEIAHVSTTAAKALLAGGDVVKVK
jgi:hypothetical protein